MIIDNYPLNNGMMAGLTDTNDVILFVTADQKIVFHFAKRFAAELFLAELVDEPFYGVTIINPPTGATS